MARKLKSGQEGLLSIIGDEDTVTGFLLAGIGDIDQKKNANFLIVDKNTTHSEVEDAFKRFTSRQDIAIVLIAQNVADTIRYLLDDYDQIIPAILEIPSKETPYDPSKDYILSRVKQFFAE
jgi:V-type H+-transporting ATPase subunit F